MTPCAHRALHICLLSSPFSSLTLDKFIWTKTVGAEKHTSIAGRGLRTFWQSPTSITKKSFLFSASLPVVRVFAIYAVFTNRLKYVSWDQGVFFLLFYFIFFKNSCSHVINLYINSYMIPMCFFKLWLSGLCPRISLWFNVSWCTRGKYKPWTLINTSISH